MDRQTDRHTMTAYIALAQHCMVKIVITTSTLTFHVANQTSCCLLVASL